MSKSFRVKVGVRNNALLECIEKAGYTMGVAFAEEAKVSYSRLLALVKMKTSPRTVKGELRPIVVQLSKFLKVSPAQMFHECHMEPVKVSTVERKVDAQEVFDLLTAPEQGDVTLALEHKDLVKAIDNNLKILSPREREVIERKTMGGETLDEIAASFGVTRERIRQIETKALRKLRHPSQMGRVYMALDGKLPND